MPNPTEISKVSHGTAKRLLVILAIGAAAAVAVTLVGSRRGFREPQPPPLPKAMAKMSPKQLQSHASDNGVMGGAHAADKTMAVSITKTTAANVAVQPDSIGGAKAGVQFVHIRSEFPHPSKEKALNDALAIARLKVIDHLRNLDPPVLAEPTLDDVRTKYMKPKSDVEIQPSKDDQAAFAKDGLEANRVWVEIDVEVTDTQVRELRSHERTGTAGWIAAGAFLLLGTLFAFLRFDAWTRGYLTTILAVCAAALAGGGLAFLAFVR